MAEPSENVTTAERIVNALAEHAPYTIGWPGCRCGFLDASVGDVALAQEAVRQHRILVVEDLLQAARSGSSEGGVSS